MLEEAGIGGLSSTLLTYAIALVAGLILFAIRREIRLHVPLETIWLALAAGWTNLAYVLAVIDGEVMRVMLLFYLSPLWTLPLARLLLQEQIGQRGFAIVTLSLVGALIMLWQPQRGLPLPQDLAEWLGLSAGIGFALTNVLTRRAQHLSLQAKSIAVWGGVILMTLLVLPFMHSGDAVPAIPGVGVLLMIAGIGLLLMVTTLLVQYGITHTPATRASVIFLFELVVAAVASWWLAGEAMSLREWVGGGLIVAAALFASRS